MQQSGDSLRPLSAAGHGHGVDPANVFGHLTALAPQASSASLAPARTHATTTASTAGMPNARSAAGAPALLPGETLVFHIAAITLLLVYCATLLAFRTNVVRLLRIMGSRLHTDKILAEQNFTFRRFISMMTLVGMVALPMMIIHLAGIAAPVAGPLGGITSTGIPHSGIGPAGILFAGIPSGAPAWMLLASLPVLAAIVVFIWLYRRIVLGVSGWLTCGGNFTSSVLYLTRMIFAIATLVLTPILVPLALDRHPAAGITLGAVLALGVVIGVGLLISKTFTLFVTQKVSILHWILYLCTVEIFPLSLVALLALR